MLAGLPPPLVSDRSVPPLRCESSNTFKEARRDQPCFVVQGMDDEGREGLNRIQKSFDRSWPRRAPKVLVRVRKIRLGNSRI